MTTLLPARKVRPVSWLKAARRDFEDLPHGAQLKLRQALTVVAEGAWPDIAKPLKGFGSGVIELALRHGGDAYRVVYAQQLDTDIWVVHAFQKKSKKGSATPKMELDLITSRLKRLEELLNEEKK